MALLARVTLVLALVLVIHAPAAKADDLTANADFSLAPQSGTFYSDAFKASDWAVETGISAPNPPVTEILPTKVTTLNLPPATQMTFNPGAMPVCPDSAIGPATNNSVEVPVIVARCPNSVIGNGTATLLLNRVNNPTTSPPRLDGQVIVFNGGLNGGQPRLKFWAYSYDTGVAIYTEGTLSPQGELSIPIPQLTSDSAVNSFNIEIPGETTDRYLPAQDITVTIPGGQKADYVQAKCDTGTFPFSADFLLGRRLTDGTPFGQELLLSAGQEIDCVGNPLTLYPLSVAKSGDGSGTISSSPAGVNCGDSCIFDFEEATVVTLSASPSGGSTFNGWSGACTNQSGDCVVTMSQARSVVASFSPTTPPLISTRLTAIKAGKGTGRITSEPVGINCGNICEADFEPGTVVSLSADPASGSAFSGWSGSCTNESGDCVVTMSQARSVVASFSSITPPPSAARLNSIKVSGPGKARLGRSVSFRVTLENVGEAPATGVSLTASGRGARVRTTVGEIGPKSRRTVRISVRFRKAGRTRLEFNAGSLNAGSQRSKKAIRIVR